MTKKKHLPTLAKSSADPRKSQPQSSPMVTADRVTEAPAPSRSSSSIPQEEMVRQQAYHLWQDAGCPCGDGVQFWLEAEQQLLQTSGGVEQ